MHFCVSTFVHAFVLLL
ncbi:hypothetical protein MIMGU_mgv11b0218512mg, partial [Erythranthe guttata]